jgi:hypothetical protein
MMLSITDPAKKKTIVTVFTKRTLPNDDDDLDDVDDPGDAFSRILTCQ